MTYDLVLKAGGDGAVLNTACVPADQAKGEPCATAELGLPALEIAKQANVTEVSALGSEVDYTVTVTNPGPGDWTAANPAVVSDDLSDVLDDAALVGGSLQATVNGVEVTTPSFDPAAKQLDWTGALSAGESVVLSYSVAYNGTGDHRLVNTACVPVETARPGVEPCASVTVVGGLLRVDKTTKVSDVPLKAGSTVEYTLTFGGTGHVPTSVNYVDHLVGVLDDAEVTVEPHAGVGDLVAVRDGDQIAITGAVPAGEQMTVVYQVTVGADADRGDSVLLNLLIPAEMVPPTDVPTSCVSPEASDGVVATTCTPVATPSPVVPEKQAPVQPLSATGDPVGPAMPATIGLLLLIAGCALFAMRRAREARAN